MRFPEAPALAGSREAFLPIVDARLAQHAAKLPAYPCLDICIVHCLAELILRGIAVYAVACLAAIFIKRFCVPDEILYTCVADLVPLPCNARLAQLRPAVQRVLVVCNPGVHDALACRLQFCRCQPLAGLQLHIQLCQLLCADFLCIVLQRQVAEAVPDFFLQYRLDVFPLFCKICSPHRVVSGNPLGKLRFVHRGHFAHVAADDAATGEDTTRHLVRQLRDLLLCCASGLVVHLPLDDCVCCRRRPGICAVDLVAPVCLRVDALAWEDQRIVSVLRMPLARLHNSDRRRRDSAELQHTVHLLAVQIVNGHQVLRLLNRLVHREPGLDRQPLLCYTGLRSICGHPNRAVFRFSCTILVLTGRRRCFLFVLIQLDGVHKFSIRLFPYICQQVIDPSVDLHSLHEIFPTCKSLVRFGCFALFFAASAVLCVFDQIKNVPVRSCVDLRLPASWRRLLIAVDVLPQIILIECRVIDFTISRCELRCAACVFIPHDVHKGFHALLVRQLADGLAGFIHFSPVVRLSDVIQAVAQIGIDRVLISSGWRRRAALLRCQAPAAGCVSRFNLACGIAVKIVAVQPHAVLNVDDAVFQLSDFRLNGVVFRRPPVQIPRQLFFQPGDLFPDVRNSRFLRLVPVLLPILRRCAARKPFCLLNGVLDFVDDRRLWCRAQLAVQRDLVLAWREIALRIARQLLELYTHVAQLRVRLEQFLVIDDVLQRGIPAFHALAQSPVLSAPGLVQLLKALLVFRLPRFCRTGEHLVHELLIFRIVRVAPAEGCVSAAMILHLAVVDLETQLSFHAGVPAGFLSHALIVFALHLKLLCAGECLLICCVCVHAAVAVALWRPSPALCRRCCLAARRGDLPLLQNRLRLAAVLFGVGAEEVDSRVSVRADFFFDDAVSLGYFLSGCVLRQIIYAAQVLQILLDHCVKFFPAVLFDDGPLDLPHKPRIVGRVIMERLVVCDLVDVQIAVVCLDDDAVFCVDAACRAHRAICLADADGTEHIRHRFPGLIGNALRRLLHLRIPVRFRHDLNLAFLRSVRQAQALAAYFFEP